MTVAYLVGAPHPGCLHDQATHQTVVAPTMIQWQDMHLESFHQNCWHHHPSTPYFWCLCCYYVLSPPPQECDCGKSADPCCDCSTCSLLNSSRCSALDACCDASTCSLKAAGVACRAATSSCDRPEQCSSNSPLCPVDEGEPWGTPCMATDGTASTCYGKVCLPSCEMQFSERFSCHFRAVRLF